MSTTTKVVGFGVGLLAVFGAATGLGMLVGPVGEAEPGGPPTATETASTHPSGPVHRG